MNLFESLNTDDVVAWLFLILILSQVGNAMAGTSLTVYRWRRVVAAGFFVWFFLTALYTIPPHDAGELLHIAFRGCLALGFGYGAGAIVLSVITFFLSHLAEYFRTSPPPPVLIREVPKEVIKYVREPLPVPTRDEVLRKEEAEHTKQLEIAEQIGDEELKAAVIDRENRRHDSVITKIMEPC